MTSPKTELWAQGGDVEDFDEVGVGVGTTVTVTVKVDLPAEQIGGSVGRITEAVFVAVLVTVVESRGLLIL